MWRRAGAAQVLDQGSFRLYTEMRIHPIGLQVDECNLCTSTNIRARAQMCVYRSRAETLCVLDLTACLPCVLPLLALSCDRIGTSILISLLSNVVPTPAALENLRHY